MKKAIEMTNIGFKIPVDVKRKFELICTLNHWNMTDFLIEEINKLITENQETIEMMGGQDD